MAEPDSALIPETGTMRTSPRHNTTPQSAVIVGTTGDSGTSHEIVHHSAHSASRKTVAKGDDGGRRLFRTLKPPIHHRQSPQSEIPDRHRVCVALRRLAPGRRERISYDLFAANGTPIPTYVWYTLTRNLGLRRDIT